MILKEFLNESAHSHAREEIFNHKLLFDLKIAAGECGYHLQNYYSDVDHNGFDLILDDGVNLRKMQIKSVDDNATKKWDIHRGLLRPLENNLEAFGFQYKNPQFDEGRICWGAEGGVILIGYKVKKGNVEITYRYADMYTISAISLGLLHRPKQTIEAANGVRQGLPNRNPTDKIGISKGLFVEASTPAHLLNLVGMENPFKLHWQWRVRSLAEEEWGAKGRTHASVLKEYRNDFPEIMKKVSGCNKP